MITNINFPEGTQVTYQRGSILDQFVDPPSFGLEITNGGGYYEYSSLYSARNFNGALGYCFRYSKCIYKLNHTRNNVPYTFNEGYCYYDVILDKSINITNATSFLNNAKTPKFMKVSANITGSSNSNFMSGAQVYYLDWDVDTSTWSTNYIFGHYLRAVNGLFSTANYNNISYYALTGFTKADWLRKFTIKDLGTKSSFTSGDFTYWTVWGVNNAAIPDARQSLIDSLITYSFDRAAAGYSKCTIKLSANTKALLTEEEIAQITAKGFTIA